MDISQKVPTGINYTTTQDQRGRNAYLAKVGTLIILTFGSAFLLGQYLSYSFYKNVFSLPDIAIPLIITFVVFLTFFFHSVLFVQKKKVLTLIAVGSAAAIAVSFFSLSNVPLLVGIGLQLVIFIYTAYSTKTELDTRIKIRFVHALNSVTTKVILAIAILLASTFFGAIANRKLDENNFLLPKSVFLKIVPFAQGPAQSLFGDIDLRKSLQEIAQERVREAIIGQVGGEQAAQIPEATRNQMTQQYTHELQTSFEDLFGIELRTDTPVADALYDGLLEKFNTSNAGAKTVALWILAILFVFAIQATAIVIRIALIPIAYLVYEFLLRSKFAHIVYENASKEKVTL